MTRNAGNILVLGRLATEPTRLEQRLLEAGVDLRMAHPGDAAHCVIEHVPDVVLVSLPVLREESGNLLGHADRDPRVMAVLQEVEALDLEASLQEAMRLGAREVLVPPFEQDAEQECLRILHLIEEEHVTQELGAMRNRESQATLRQQVADLKERCLQQGRSNQEALDVFYLDLSRMMTIIDNIGDGIVFTDPEGQITLLNPVAAELLGIKPIVAIGKRLRQLEGWKDLLSQVDEFQRQAMIEGGSEEVTLELHHEEHDLLYLQVNTTAVTDYKGAFAGILTVIKDVSAEHKAEENKNQFLSILSHELRTPLTGIKTFATLLARGALGEMGERQQGVAESIREQALRLEHEIDKLICLGRIESGEFAMDLEVFPVVDLLDLAVVPFEQAAREGEIDFRLELPAFCPLVRADREDLRRALQALIENAIKFTPSGGRVQVTVAEESDSVVVFVEDTGPGIDKRYQRRIFEKFYQVEDPLTRHHGGAGLGLCVAKGVALAHGGEILVESDLGKGARFGIRLPKFDMHQLEEAESLAV
ncbi:MAG: ATP-binding protein [Planctomycetota bacterium]